jgi:hypothetical protein
MDLSLTVSLTDDQTAAVDWQVNLHNRANPEAKIDRTGFIQKQVENFLTGFAQARSAERNRHGLALYAGAEPTTKVKVSELIGLTAEFPTGQEDL